MDVDKHIEKAEEAVRRRNYDFAISLYLQLLQISPNNQKARGGLYEAALRLHVRSEFSYSLETIIQRLNRNLRGWHAYFRHCHWSIFREYDQLVRRRLRRLLLKRHRRNRKRLPANQRWPNEYFHERGLYSLSEAHVRFVQTTGTY